MLICIYYMCPIYIYYMCPIYIPMYIYYICTIYTSYMYIMYVLCICLIPSTRWDQYNKDVHFLSKKSVDNGGNLFGFNIYHVAFPPQ